MGKKEHGDTMCSFQKSAVSWTRNFCPANWLWCVKDNAEFLAHGNFSTKSKLFAKNMTKGTRWVKIMKNGCYKSITWILDTFLLLNSFGPIINGLNHYSKEAEDLNKFHRIFFILKNIVLTPWYHWHSWFKHPSVWLRTIKDIAAIFKF